MDEKIIRLKQLESGVLAMTLRDKNGDYNVYIDPRHSHYVQKSAYDHEMAHIDKDHFDSTLHVTELEKEI